MPSNAIEPKAVDYVAARVMANFSDINTSLGALLRSLILTISFNTKVYKKKDHK